jgi:MATE family multidrug resistance protein
MREVVRIALPAIVTQLSVTLMWIADTFFVGRLGSAEQGAVGFAGAVVWTLCSFVAGTLTAVQIFVAQHVGAGSGRQAGGVTWQGIAVAGMAAIPVFAIGLAGESFLSAFHIHPALFPHAVTYFRIRLLGAGANFLTFACDGYLRGIGDTRTPMLITLAANIVNIVLDYLLIFGHAGFPRMGVAGAAWATVASSALQGLVMLVIFIRRGRREGHLPERVVKPAAREIVRLLRVGTPVGMQWVLDMGSWTAFTTLVAGLGEVQAAANQVAISILHVSFMPGYGISIAATTLVGQYLGAGNPKAAIRSAHHALQLAVVFMGVMGAGFLVGRGALIRSFNPDPAVIAVGGQLLVIAAVFQVFDAVNLVLSGVLRGAGDTRFPMLVTIVMAWFVFLPAAWFMTIHLGWGVVGGWVAVIFWAAGLALLLGWRFQRRKWLGMLLVERPVATAGIE